MVEILTMKQNTPEWHAVRKGKATGSNAGILLTKGLEEAINKNGNKTWGGNFYTQRGHILEDEAIELYEQIYETEVARPGAVINTLYKNALCSPDGVCGDDLLEVKAFNAKKHLGMIDDYIKSSVVNFDILAQIQFNMLITDLKRARLILYNPEVDDDDMAYFIITIDADKAIHNNMSNILNGIK